MTAPLNHCRLYSYGYDKEGHYYETWIEDGDDERPDRDYWEEYENGRYAGLVGFDDDVDDDD